MKVEVWKREREVVSGSRGVRKAPRRTFHDPERNTVYPFCTGY